MKTRLLSPLVKVFPEAEPTEAEFRAFSYLRNEIFHFQLALKPESPRETDAQVTLASDLLNDLSLYVVEQMPSTACGYDEHDDFHYDVARPSFPDLLRPTDGTLRLNAGEWTALWITCRPTQGLTGEHPITLTVKTDDGEMTAVFTPTVIARDLPAQTLLYTNWFHNDCLCTYYGAEPFSERYWPIAEAFLRNAVAHGVNLILTPVFTPPLDTAVGGERPTVQLVDVTKTGDTWSFGFENFEKYIRLCRRCGIEHFEISHFFTQWGAKAAPKIVATVDGELRRVFGWETDSHGPEYTAFLTAFAAAFCREVDTLGIRDKCFLHISDEPGRGDRDAYRLCAETVRRLFPGFRFLDALSDLFYVREGLADIAVCGIDHADEFRPEVDEFWTYYCGGGRNHYVSNRLFAQPSLRNRVLGMQLWRYDATGFLHWGYNFWYSQYSRHPIDPFTVTDADRAFPSGDSFSVYPGPDGTPLNALRHEVFADGLQDLRALRLLESLTSREHVLGLLEEGLAEPLGVSTYPHDDAWLLGVRAKINGELARL